MIDTSTCDASRIWHAGVQAVGGKQLIQQAFAIRNDSLIIDELHEISLANVDRILVLGAGKASAGMADGFECFWRQHGRPNISVDGWLNVPQGTFSPELVQRLETSPHFRIHLHPAREAGANEPTEQGVLGTRKILELASQADATSLVLCFISGGASALLPAPAQGLSLADKLELTRFFSRSGASIEIINEVRRCLSDIKGGGLARAASRAQKVVTLVLSDVLGDPVHLIGSGPTVLDPVPDPAKALSLVEQWDPQKTLPRSVRETLRHRANATGAAVDAEAHKELSDRVSTYVLANNATAVDAAGVESVALGYSYWMESVQEQGLGLDAFAKTLLRGIEMAVAGEGPDCLILGGEPTLTLPPLEVRGRGGRNQHLALELMILMSNHSNERIRHSEGIAVVCGGTDGEDGPTLAAGALINAHIMKQAQDRNLDLRDFAKRCDAYSFFTEVGGLLVTGPTNTNVCDLSVAVIAN